VTKKKVTKQYFIPLEKLNDLRFYECLVKVKVKVKVKLPSCKLRIHMWQRR